MSTVNVDEKDWVRQSQAITERGGYHLEATRDAACKGIGGADSIGLEFGVERPEPGIPPRVTARTAGHPTGTTRRIQGWRGSRG